MLILMGNCSLKKLWSPCLPTDFCFFMNLARSKSLIILSVGDLHELFSPNWIDFQMFKLVLEKAEEPGINCQHSKYSSPRKTQDQKKFTSSYNSLDSV